MSTLQKITPFLWFDKEAGDAAKFYTSIFNNSKMSEPDKINDTPSGEAQVYSVELCGQQFTLMNAGPHFKFNEAISFVVACEDQNEIDYFWEKLTSNGGSEGRCGWLKDKFGVSWQVTPLKLGSLLSADKTGEVMQAMLKMNKIIIEDLKVGKK